MMVESEAKELSRRRHARRGHVRPSRQRRRSCEGIIKLAEKAAKDPWELAHRATTRTRSRQSSRSLIGKDIDAAYKLTDKSAALRPRSTKPATKAKRSLRRRSSRRTAATSAREAGEEARGRHRPQARSSRKAAASTAATPRRFARSRRWSASCRAPTARPCSPAARPRRSSSTTLGTKDSEQMIDGLEGLSYSRFMLHYNFPPYSVGEVGRFGAPSRREIGHGKLAWRALHPMLPSDRGVPLHDPRPVRHHREQRLLVDGDGVRRLAGDDGRRRSAQAPGRRHRHGPDPRRQGLRGALRHPRRRGSSRRHGLQGRRHVAKASPRCRWTSRSPESPRRS